MLTGWALDPGATYRYQCDAAFPLTDHADYPDLLRYVELVQPKRVLTLHGFAAEFAGDLRDRGVEAWALTEANQLELRLTSSPPKSLDAVAGSNINIESLPSAPPESSPTPAVEAFIRSPMGEELATASKLRKSAVCQLCARSWCQSSTRCSSAGCAFHAISALQPFGRAWRAPLAVSGVGVQRLRQIGAT